MKKLNSKSGLPTKHSPLRQFMFEVKYLIVNTIEQNHEATSILLVTNLEQVFIQLVWKWLFSLMRQLIKQKLNIFASRNCWLQYDT